MDLSLVLVIIFVGLFLLSMVIGFLSLYSQFLSIFNKN